MDTLGGKLNLNGGRYDIVYMNTAGGDISATYEASNVTPRTLGGNVRVRLPADTLFTVDASTFGGRVRHGSIHMSPTTNTDWSLAGPTDGGAGNLKVTMKTMGGNIDIDY
jgi:DUF4097 and DUF4098 domain-containing protein YvlB